jgi:hypothetical protein
VLASKVEDAVGVATGGGGDDDEVAARPASPA